MFNRIVTTALLFLLCVVAVSAAWTGVDYGRHGDEHWLLNGLRDSVTNMLLMPRRYVYSGMYFNVGYLGLSPELIKFWSGSVELVREKPERPFRPENYPGILKMQEELVEKVKSDGFKLRMRRIFALISSAAIIIVYFIVRTMGRPRAEALLGAGLIALSWEVNYHSRHIAVDNMLMVFGALTLLCIIKSLNAEDVRERSRWQGLAAVAAGLGAGSKLTGVFLVVPLLTAIVICRGGASVARLTGRIAVVLSITALTLAITTPGLLLEPVRVANDWAAEAQAYASGYSSGYSHFTGSRTERLFKVFYYFANDLTSHYRPVSLTFAVFAAVGFWFLFKGDRRVFLTFISLPAAYLVFFSGMSLFIVRNFMVLVPFFAVASARGVGETYSKLSSLDRLKPLRYALPVVVLCWVSLNSYWLFHTAGTVRPVGLPEAVNRLEDYIAGSGDKFVLSPMVMAVMGRGLPGAAEADGYCAMFYSEHPFDKWKANRKGLYKDVLTSLEVNYDYYPSWEGRNTPTRIVILSLENAREMGFDCYGGFKVDVVPQSAPL